MNRNYETGLFESQEPIEVPIKTSFDWKASQSFQSALKDVKKQLKNLPNQFTVAQLVRAFPKYERIILDVLESLRDIKAVHYVDYKPMPTRVEKM